MQGLHTLSSSSSVSSPTIQRQHPSTHLPTLTNQHNSNRLVRALASKKRAKGTQQPTQQQQQQGTSIWEDPRLQWAKPEWIQQQTDKQVTKQQPHPQQQSSSSSSGIAQLAAAARSSPLQRPAAKPGPQKPVMSEQERQRVLQKMTYGSFSSTDEDEASSSSSSSSKSADVPQLFAAMGIDFGERRVGMAVRRPPYNIPLTTLWTEALQQADSSSSRSSTTNTSASDSTSTDTSSTTSSSSSAINSPPKPWRRIDIRKLAQKLLQVALQEGCDGFVVGVPVLNPTTARANALGTQTPGQKAAPGVTVPGDLGDTTSAAVRGTRRLTENIRSFALVLANAAADYELPVLLVNEQQSSQQARAIRAGKAAYDVITFAELQQREQQQLQQQQNLGQSPRQQQQEEQQDLQQKQDTRQQLQQQQQDTRQQQEQLQQLQQQQQQQQQAGERSKGKREAVPGRDAFAAALILSRYYNGVVEPLEVVWASRHQRQQQEQQQEKQQEQQPSSTQQEQHQEKQ